MAHERVLVIEDESAIREGICDALQFESYTVLEAATGDDGLDIALGAQLDLILLDLALPWKTSRPPGSGDGLEILRQVRQVQPTLPVIILTARGQESDRVLGLKLGADDYVVKPFSVRELLARVQAVLRRSPQRPLDIRAISLPSGTVDLDRLEVRFDTGDRIELSEREMQLIRYLALHAGRAISRHELLANVWRIDPRGVDTRAVDMQIVRLREKLRDDPHHPRMLLTVRGKGYMLARQEAPA